MNIALLAHDNRKELMIQFCVAHSGVLSGHKLFAPTTTGQLVSNATGLQVELVLPCGGGGCQQIESRIAYSEIDLVLFFCDASGRRHTKDIDSISRVCDKKNVPIATNVATAEDLMQGLHRGTWAGWSRHTMRIAQ